MNNNSIYGAVIGDIAGSIYEVNEIFAKKNKTKIAFKERIKILDMSTPLLEGELCYTDDTTLTTAIANAIITNTSYESNLRTFASEELAKGFDRYGRFAFGPNFVLWVKNEHAGDSFGNGCAMRVSAVGYAFDSLKLTIEEAKKATTPSHNSEEAIKCAQIVAGSIFLARIGKTKKDIKMFVEKQLQQNLNFDLSELQKNYTFSSKAINSVPQALFCFLESSSYEDCIRKTISIGGDTDTNAAISGSVAAAFYGVPNELADKAKSYLPKSFISVLDEFSEKYITDSNKNEK